VPHMLLMPAFENSHPVTFVIPMEARDSPVHAPAVRPAYLLRYTSVLKYLSPESTMRVTTLAPGPSRSAT
jgi:hypothetical protein